MARPREPSRSAAAGAGGVSTAGWSRPASARRRPRGPTREYPSSAERGGLDRDRDPVSAASFRLPGGFGLGAPVLLSRAQPSSPAHVRALPADGHRRRNSGRKSGHPGYDPGNRTLSYLEVVDTTVCARPAAAPRRVAGANRLSGPQG